MSTPTATEPRDTVATAAALPSSGPRGRTAPAAVLVVGALLATLPLLEVTVPGLFPGELASPGTLQILAVGLVFAALAMSYDLLLGYTGLLSLGHALYFSLGLYGTNLLMGDGRSFLLAAPVAIVGVAVVATAVGAVALRVRGVAFAMVTLAFAEAFRVFVESDPLDVSGGEEGLALASDGVPSLLSGVVNTRWLYWAALAFALLVFAICRQAVASRAGHVWKAVRENEDRVELLGLVPFTFKLLSFSLAGTLAAAAGALYLLLVRGSTPDTTAATFTLNIIVMVVLGGLGRLWGAALGGLLFGYLSLRLPDVARSGVFDGLPGWIQGPLTEPLFILGVLFVALVMFAPGGLASILERTVAWWRTGTGARR